MRIQNNYDKAIWWWSYKEGDTVYAIALAKGEIPAKSTKAWRDDSFPKFKLQIARDWSSWGINNYTTILDPGVIYTHDDDFIVTAAGTASKATVQLDEQPVTERRVVAYNFVDRRTQPESRNETVESEFYKAFSQSLTMAETREHTQTWKVGGKIGGTVRGADLSAFVGFEDRVSSTLENSYQASVEQSFSERRSTVMTLPGGKITVVKTVWLAQIQTGSVSYFGHTATFEVPVGADATSSLKVEATYDDPDQMDSETRAAWDRLEAA